MHRQCKLILYCQSIPTVYSAKSLHYIPLQLYDMEKCLISIGCQCKFRIYPLNSMIYRYLLRYFMSKSIKVILWCDLIGCMCKNILHCQCITINLYKNNNFLIFILIKKFPYKKIVGQVIYYIKIHPLKWIMNILILISTLAYIMQCSYYLIIKK
jgi:hypothetical protein